jgi:hypothetical protein
MSVGLPVDTLFIAALLYRMSWIGIPVELLPFPKLLTGLIDSLASHPVLTVCNGGIGEVSSATPGDAENAL